MLMYWPPWSTMIRLPKPRSHSANTTRPPATARTSAPSLARMNTPFQLGPSPRLAPNLAASLPATGARSWPLRLANAPAGAAGASAMSDGLAAGPAAALAAAAFAVAAAAVAAAAVLAAAVFAAAALAAAVLAAT